MSNENISETALSSEKKYYMSSGLKKAEVYEKEMFVTLEDPRQIVKLFKNPLFCHNLALSLQICNFPHFRCSLLLFETIDETPLCQFLIYS